MEKTKKEELFVPRSRTKQPIKVYVRRKLLVKRIDESESLEKLLPQDVLLENSTASPAKPLIVYVRRKRSNHVLLETEKFLSQEGLENSVAPKTSAEPSLKVYFRKKIRMKRFDQSDPLLLEKKLENSIAPKTPAKPCNNIRKSLMKEINGSEDQVEDDSYDVNGKRKLKNSTVTLKKQRFHSSKFMEDGKNLMNSSTTRLRTISKKRKNNDPEKQSLPKRRKNDANQKLARTFALPDSLPLAASRQEECFLSSPDTLMSYASCATPKEKRHKKKIGEYCLLSSLDDKPLETEEGPITRSKNAAKGLLSTKKEVAALTKLRLQALKRVTPKVDFDSETLEEWKLLMESDDPNRLHDDEKVELRWKEEREIFRNRTDVFLRRMNIMQGDRKFKHWKGSVADSVVGVFLTQTVGDHLSSNAFMSMAAKFPLAATNMDSVDWNTVRSSGQKVLENTIKGRGQQEMLSTRILLFLKNEAQKNGRVSLEWLRNASPRTVSTYLLGIKGIGLKSAECIRLLALKHSAFPVDRNVGRIAVRLGWVPIQPLPNGVQMHQLIQYPAEDSVHNYLWPRLCKFPQEILYELHYQLITFGKVFCTKDTPNCNQCPMKLECKYFASAYISSKVLPSPKAKTHSSDSQDVAVNMKSGASQECNEQTNHSEPGVEFTSSRSTNILELTDIEDYPCESSHQSYAETDIDMDVWRNNLEDALLKCRKIFNICDDQILKAAVLNSKNACLPIESQEIKNNIRLRTEHWVYVLSDDCQLLHDFERREPDDPSPYLLSIWQPGEVSCSYGSPKKKCDSDGSKLCKKKSCSFCCSRREQTSNIFRGTILIPCRTALRGRFPLNGTYFQTNEVFADHETSLNPITFPREWCDGLKSRLLYCGSTVQSIFRSLDETSIRSCFGTGFVCIRAFNRKERKPEVLVARLHTSSSKGGTKRP